jgi:diaminopimelate epimerase
VRFEKWQGTGNDFVIVDAVERPSLALVLGERIRQICDRHRGVGADGVLNLYQDDAGYRMDMFNPDGSPSEMCGNGLRCAARYLHVAREAPRDMTVGTGAGPLRCILEEGDQVRVFMGIARLRKGEIGMAGSPEAPGLHVAVEGFADAMAVGMGNPHLIVFVDDLTQVDLARQGAELEHHPDFPNRTNVHFVQARTRGEVQVLHWERGAGATAACGTGACAVAVACVTRDRTDPTVAVDVPGGRLLVTVRADLSVELLGPAHRSFTGNWPD